MLTGVTKSSLLTGLPDDLVFLPTAKNDGCSCGFCFANFFTTLFFVLFLLRPLLHYSLLLGLHPSHATIHWLHSPFFRASLHPGLQPHLLYLINLCSYPLYPRLMLGLVLRHVIYANLCINIGSQRFQLYYASCES